MSLFSRTDRKQSIIEFQSRLLQDLSLNSGPLQNRQDPIRNVAATVREILDVYFLFTVLPADDSRYELLFYWCGSPSQAVRTNAEQAARAAVAGDPARTGGTEFTVTNTPSDGALMLPHLEQRDLDLRTLSFETEARNSSGMAGIGLRKKDREGLEDRAVIDSILAAMKNNACSARALATYTREIERFATRDPLTNLYNQNAFWDLLNYETERSRRQQYKFSLIVIDLDNFKTINDSYGHDVGDRLLREFAGILKSAVRGGDIAARYAGDQFTAILPVCDEGQAYIVARRIIENLRGFSLKIENGTVLRQTVSIGLAVFPDHAREARDLYLLADSMVLQAKTFGKDRLSMPSEHEDLAVLKSMGDKNLLILEALSQRKIMPYFQPIMNTKSREIEAYEVLTRIVMDGRVIPAAEFIESAESMGVIGRIDYQLMELAFSKVRSSGYDGMLFLNLSPMALVINEFVPTIRQMLRDYEIDPAKMVFEITERDTIKNPESIRKYLRELKDDGFRFAIDDFGAGYSSFEYIRNFNIEFLKVYGEFIQNMNGTGAIEKAIVSSIAALAEKLNIKTIAEYVETEDILRQVESAGIQYAQGYYIRRPSPDLH